MGLKLMYSFIQCAVPPWFWVLGTLRYIHRPDLHPSPALCPLLVGGQLVGLVLHRPWRQCVLRGGGGKARESLPRLQGGRLDLGSKSKGTLAPGTGVGEGTQGASSGGQLNSMFSGGLELEKS